MSLHEKSTSPRRSLYSESYKIARSNMIFGVMLWAGIQGILVLIHSRVSSKPDPGFALKIFALLAVLGIAASLLPTILGAKVLSVWLERSNATKRSAMMAGAIIGAFVISLFTVPMIVWFDFEIDYSFRSIILLVIRFHLPITICAALAGGRTGLQLAKFIETRKTTLLGQNQTRSTHTNKL